MGYEPFNWEAWKAATRVDRTLVTIDKRPATLGNPEQFPLKFTVLARSTDPPTSFAAARSMREAAAHHATLIIGALQRPATATEIAEYTGLDAVQVCRRLTELERLVVIRPTGATRKTASGRQSREWERVK